MIQREQDPGVNSFQPADPDLDHPTPSRPADDIEQPPDTEVIPVPPDSGPKHPIEEPPREDDAPIGDVDDSPKQIVEHGPQ